MAVLGDEQLGDLALAGRAFDRIGDHFVFVFVVLVHVGAVDEDDDIGVLLDGAAFAQVAEHGDGRFAALDGAGELGDGEDGHVKFAGDFFEGAGDDAEFGDAVGFDGGAGPGVDELDVVDDDQAEAAGLGGVAVLPRLAVEQAFVEVAGFGADFGEGLAGGVVDIDFGAAE